MIKKSGIKTWAEDDRPREKLLKNGERSLSDAELLAIIIHSGNKHQSALDLSKEILKSVNNNLNDLAKLRVEDLKKFKGIGSAKAINIVASIALGGRRESANFTIKNKITCSSDVFNYLKNSLINLNIEEFWILLLNKANKIIGKKQISQGGITGTVVDLKIIFKYAIEYGASSIILCHNHPSGNINPSTEDINITTKIKQAGDICDIKVLDHIIIGENTYYSFADNNNI